MNLFGGDLVNAMLDHGFLEKMGVFKILFVKIRYDGKTEVFCGWSGDIISLQR